VSSIAAAVDKANNLTSVPFSDQVTIAVAEGVYTERVSKSLQRPIILIGGFDTAFSCRSRILHETKIVGVDNTATVFFDQQGATLDGLTIVGADPQTTNAPTRALFFSGNRLTLRDSTIISHMTGTGGSAGAAEIWRSDLDISDTTFIARDAASSGSVALDICNAKGTIARVRADSDDGLTGTALRVRHASAASGDCGGTLNRGTIVVASSQLRASGNTAVAVRAVPVAGEVTSTVELDIRHSALVSTGNGVANGLLLSATSGTTDGRATAVLDHATIFARPTAATTSIGVANAIDGTITLRNAIVVAGHPVETTTATFTMTKLAAGASSTIVYPTGAHATDGFIVTFSNGTGWPIDEYQFAVDPGAIQADPKLQSDNVHLQPMSIARALHGDCGLAARDIDGETKPQPTSTFCDVGADEIP
jgi:hypothetical protein